MGISELDFVNRTEAEARVRPVKKDNGYVHPWKRGGYDPYETQDFVKKLNDEAWQTILKDAEQPCAIQRAYENWLANGSVGTFSIMMVCKCPKCTIRCGKL